MVRRSFRMIEDSDALTAAGHPGPDPIVPSRADLRRRFGFGAAGLGAVLALAMLLACVPCSTGRAGDGTQIDSRSAERAAIDYASALLDGDIDRIMAVISLPFMLNGEMVVDHDSLRRVLADSLGGGQSDLPRTRSLSVQPRVGIRTSMHIDSFGGDGNAVADQLALTAKDHMVILTLPSRNSEGLQVYVRSVGGKARIAGSWR